MTLRKTNIIFICMTYDNKTYSALQIAKILGIPRSNIQQYIDKGFITASGKKADGKGTRNEFSRDDIVHLRLFLDIFELGIPQNKASKLSYELLEMYSQYEMPLEDVFYEWFYILKDGRNYRG